MKYWYTYEGSGIETFNEGFDIESNWEPRHADYVAEQAAEDYFDNHDGWEDDWPVVIVVWDEHGKHLGDFSVEIEARPHFYTQTIGEG